MGRCEKKISFSSLVDSFFTSIKNEQNFAQPQNTKFVSLLTEIRSNNSFFFFKYFCRPKKDGFNGLAMLSTDLSLLFGLLGQQNCLDVWQDTSLSDCDSGEKFVQLFVVTDGQLQVTRDDSGLLVVTGSVSSQLENFSCQIFHDGSQVDWSSGTDALCVVSFAQQTMNTTDWELQTSTI
jgi:hypothetical protein